MSDESRFLALPVVVLDRRGGLAPVLDLIHGYPRDEEGGPVPTDVYSFHVDSATTETDTWLCTYHGPTSDGLRNDEQR